MIPVLKKASENDTDQDVRYFAQETLSRKFDYIFFEIILFLIIFTKTASSFDE